MFKSLIGVLLFFSASLMLKQVFLLFDYFLIFSVVLCFILAQIKGGESVLIHAGASGVGTAAIQLARLFCAIPLVTAGSPDKLKIAEKLGAAAGFNYKDGDFSDKILQFTQGELCKVYSVVI